LKYLPVWTNGAFPDYPFLDRMTIVFVFLILLMVTMSLLDRRSKDQPRVIVVDPGMFKTSPSFIVGSVLILGILTALYSVFW
jgi:SSS family solute:Na+ symporter